MAKEHLEEMVDKTRKLGYSDIEILNRNKKREQNELESDEFIENKERDT